MAIEYQVLGDPGRDNALLATVDSGQSVHHLLFDCGQSCLSKLPGAQVGEIEALFFSHFHMDHVAGFDSFFRANWCRPDRPVRLFGPPGTIDIIHHRMRGFIWNLSTDSPGEWIVSEIDGQEIRVARFFASDGFAQRHEIGPAPFQPGATIHSGKTFEVGAITLDHGTPSMGYLVREHDHSNVGSGRLEELGMPPGPWLKTLKDRGTSDDRRIEVQGVAHRVGELRAQLLETAHGDSIAYLTDFRLDPGGDDGDQLVHFLNGCQTMVCENNYRNSEALLAARHHHMTSGEVAGLAARVGPERLILFHLSDRYSVEDWHEQLAEVRSRFTRAEFPPEWF